MSDGYPGEFRTSDHKWLRQELPDGQTVWRKDGQFAPQENFRRAYWHAHVEVTIPDPETGGTQTVTVTPGEASAIGVAANSPDVGPDELEIETIDGDIISVPKSDLHDLFGEIDIADDGPIRYLT